MAEDPEDIRIHIHRRRAAKIIRASLQEWKLQLLNIFWCGKKYDKEKHGNPVLFPNLNGALRSTGCV